MAEPIDHSRRAMLRGSFLTREGREEVARQQRPLGTAPPGLDDMGDACTVCQSECMAACPQKIIRIHAVDHSCKHTPYLDFSRAGCNFCGECICACPEPDEHTKAAVLPQLPAIDLYKTQCLTWQGIFCMSCLSACEVRALSLSPRRQLMLSREQCTGCGVCVSRCPVGALA